MNARTALALAAATATLLALGCDSRGRAIRDALPEAERQRFELGRETAKPCWVCHDFYERNNKIGPTLAGIYGRAAGSVPQFAYSDAMRASGIVWSDDTLRRYLSDVQGAVPGTSMNAASIPRGPELEALLFYMRQVTQPAS